MVVYVCDHGTRDMVHGFLKARPWMCVQNLICYGQPCHLSPGAQLFTPSLATIKKLAESI